MTKVDLLCKARIAVCEYTSRLRDIAKKCDPRGVFQTLVPGGFKGLGNPRDVSDSDGHQHVQREHLSIGFIPVSQLSEGFQQVMKSIFA